MSWRSRAGAAARGAALALALDLLARPRPPRRLAGARRRRRSSSSTWRPQAGVTRVLLAGRPGKDHLLDSAGSGAAFLDFDRDGRLDIYLVNGWRLDGVHGRREGQERALSRDARRHLPGRHGRGRRRRRGRVGPGAFVADYDGDGWPDIFVTTFGANILYRNLGNGRFENIAARVGLESPGWNTGAAFFDADGDGDLDLYIAAYIDDDDRGRAATRSGRSAGRASRWWPSGRSA